MPQDQGDKPHFDFTIRPRKDGGLNVGFGGKSLGKPFGQSETSGFTLLRNLEQGNTNPTPEITGKVGINSEQLIRHFGNYIRRDVFPGELGSYIGVQVGDEENGGHVLRVLVEQRLSGGFESIGRTAVGIYYDKEGKVTKLYIPKDKFGIAMVLNELDSVNPRLAQAIRYTYETMRPTNPAEDTYFLQLPQGLEMHVEEFEGQLQEVLAFDMRKGQAALAEVQASGIMNLPRSHKERYTGSMNDVVTVIQGEVAFIQRGRGKQVVNTYGMGPCVGMLIGDRQEGAFALAHIDAATDMRASFPSVVAELHGLGAKAITIRLFGGDRGSGEIVTAIMKQAKAYGIEIVEADIMDDSQTRSVGVSTDGTIYNNTFSDHAPDEGDRLLMVGYRGTTKVPLHTRYTPQYGIR